MIRCDPVFEMMFRFILPILTLASVFFCAGCASQTGSPEPIATSSVPYVMASLDSAVIVTDDGVRQEVQVDQDGRIDLPGGSRLVRGMTSADFRNLLERSYPRAKEIKIREFRTNQVTVLGEVFHQIHTDLTEGPMRVMDAIASANGFTPLANKRRVRLVRQNADRVEVYQLDLRDLMKGSSLDQNLLLEPGDVITVPRNFL